MPLPEPHLRLWLCLFLLLGLWLWLWLGLCLFFLWLWLLSWLSSPHDVRSEHAFVEGCKPQMRARLDRATWETLVKIAGVGSSCVHPLTLL